MKLRWDGGAYEGDSRRLAWCGNAPVGAIFMPIGKGARYIRWRAWVTARFHSSEGTARSEAEAKEEVEKRFAEFLMLADLQPPKEASA